MTAVGNGLDLIGYPYSEARMVARNGLRLPIAVLGVIVVFTSIVYATIGYAAKGGDSSINPVGTPESLSLSTYLPLAFNASLASGEVAGIVIDTSGPVSGATVRVQATTNAAVTGIDGSFILTGLVPNQPVVLTAWASGYFIGGGGSYLPGGDSIELHLEAHASQDNPDYPWLSAFSDAGDELNCQNCHADPGDSNSQLPFDEWQRDAHAASTHNQRFLTMYAGTDTDGNQSPLTDYFCDQDYGCVPLPPDLSQPYYGPGYKLDFPDTAGNCAACHAPAAAVNSPYGVDPRTVSGVGSEGVACDFCHKIWDVRLDDRMGSPLENLPGVLSFELRRPPEGHQFFAGPFDDVAPGEDTYSALQTQSQICAPCHFGSFWGTQVYNSFGEWLDSPYNDPENGKTCQDCHMPPTGVTHFTRPDKGGVERNPDEIFSHKMLGAMDESLLQNAVTMTVTASLEGDEVLITVDITNDLTGHHVPTDSPLRHLVLLVQATDADGVELTQSSGPVVPDWGGQGDPAEGYYAGLPGKAYAKVLQELWTYTMPSGAYWNQTRVVSDNRLAAYKTDTSTYTFTLPEGEDITIKVELLFRRAFIEIMDQKGWDVPDIVMEQETLVLNK
jgi:hypothetical protein